jgi:hypothetical protein
MSEERQSVSMSEQRQSVSMSEQRQCVSMSEQRQCVSMSEQRQSVSMSEQWQSVSMSEQWQSVSMSEHIQLYFMWIMMIHKTRTLPQLNVWLELILPAYAHQVSYFSVCMGIPIWKAKKKKRSHSVSSHSWMQIKTMYTSRSSLSNEKAWLLIHTCEPAKHKMACDCLMLWFSITSKP